MPDCVCATAVKKIFRTAAFSFLLIYVWGCATVQEPDYYQPRTWSIGAVDYVFLDDILVRHQMDYRFDAASRKSVLQKDGQELIFQIDEPMIEINGELQELQFPPLFVDGRILLPEDLAHIQWWQGMQNSPVNRRLWQNRDRRYLRIVIDAGHGGRDHGAANKTHEEKDIVLAIAQRLHEKLEFLGHQVIMTRNRDQYLSLPDRSWIANVTGADLLISLHGNSAQNTNASGIEIYYANNAYAMTVQDVNVPIAQFDYKKQPNPAIRNHPALVRSPEPGIVDRAALFSEILSEKLNTFPVPVVNRGVKQADFFVLNGTGTPAVLIETGFITNDRELYHLIDPLYQDLLADWIVKAVTEYNREIYH